LKWAWGVSRQRATRGTFDRMARRVAIFDGHDLLGHRRGLAMVGGSLD
jgi:hypothetical protein